MVVVILLTIIACFVYQNRILKKSISEKEQSNKSTRSSADNVVIYDQPIDRHTEGNDDLNYDDVRSDDHATYTALNRTGRDDEDNVYGHLNEIQQENVNEAEV